MKNIIHIADPNNISLTVNDMIEAIADEYTFLYKEYPIAVLNTMKLEGKLVLAKMIEMGRLSIYDAVINEDYYLTTLDLWVASLRFNIPIIFYSQSQFSETDSQLIVATCNEDDAYFFVKISHAKSGTVPKCKMLYTANNKSRIPIAELSADLRD